MRDVLRSIVLGDRTNGVATRPDTTGQKLAYGQGKGNAGPTFTLLSSFCEAGRAQSSYHDFRTYWHERCKVVATRTLCIVLESKLRVCRGSTEKWSDGRTSAVYYEAVISAERRIRD